MNAFLPAVALLPFHRPSPELEPSLVEVIAAPVDPGGPDHHGGRIRHGAEPGLAFPERRLAAALGVPLASLPNFPLDRDDEAPEVVLHDVIMGALAHGL